MGLINQTERGTSLYSPISKTYAECVAEDPVIPKNILAIDTTYETIRVGTGIDKFSELRYSLTQPPHITPGIIGI